MPVAKSEPVAVPSAMPVAKSEPVAVPGGAKFRANIAIAADQNPLNCALSSWALSNDHVPLECGSDAALERAASEPSTALLVVNDSFGRAHGLELCRRVSREFHPARFVLFLGLAVSPSEAEVFGAGADDYVPNAAANVGSVIERARRLIARARSTRGLPNTRMRCGRLDIDFITQSVHVDNTPVSLTNCEFRLLTYLVMRPNQFTIASVLQVAALGGKGTSVYEHMSNLYSKLGPNGRVFMNVRGKGYVFAVDEQCVHWLPSSIPGTHGDSH